MTFRPPTGPESRSQYYGKLFSKERASRPAPRGSHAETAREREPSLYLCCSDSKDDRAYTKEIYHCLKSQSVNVFFDDEDDVDVKDWGKRDEGIKTEALFRSSHGILIVTPTLLRRDVNISKALTIADAMLERVREEKMRLLLLLVGVKRKEFNKVFPFYATLKPSQCRGSKDVLEATDKILSSITPNTEKRADSVPSSADDLLAGRQGGLPPKVVNLKGREDDVKRILDEFCHRSPSFPLCWISGQPGIGKSSLAIHIAHEVREKKWNVIFVDAQNLESEADFCTELLRNMKPYLPTDKQTAESAGPLVSEVMQLIEQVDRPCIILDGCDRALATESLSQAFLGFLWKIPKAVQRRFMLLVTSCRKAQFLTLPVLEIDLDPLENRDADNLLKSCLSYQFQRVLKESTIFSIRKLCQGVPILIRLAGAVLNKFRDVISQEETVEKLQAKPLKMFKTVNPSATAFIATIYNLFPSSLRLSLHGVALFIGPFTRIEGAHVFGLAGDGVQFGIEVIGPLQEYSLLTRSSDNDITRDQTQYRLHSLFREFLLGSDFKTPEFQKIQETYCVMQLDKIAKVQKMYDKNPQSAIMLCQMYGFSNVICELASVLRRVVETSLDVWRRLVALAKCSNSWMSHCFGKELRKTFLKVCLGVALKRNLGVVEMNIRLILTDVLLQLDEHEAASSGLEKVHQKLSSVHVPKEAKEMLEFRYCLTEAKCLTAKNEGQKAAANLVNGIKRFIWAKEQPDYYTALGNAYKCYRDYNGAIVNYRKALEQCEANFRKRQSLGFHPDISYLLLNIGHCQFCSTQFAESYESFSKALEMQRYLRSSRLWLASTFYHLGICQASRGNQLEAQNHFKEVYGLLEDTKDDQSAFYLLTRQAHAKLLYTQGIELGRTSKDEDNPSLRQAANDLHWLQNVLKPLLEDSEMRLIWAENHALLVVIYSLLSEKKQVIDHKRQLGQIDLHQELVSRCSVLSCVIQADIEDDSQQSGATFAAFKRRLSVTFHSYVGGRLMAASEERFGKKRTSSDASRQSFELEASGEGRLSRPPSPMDRWDEYDHSPDSQSISNEPSTDNITSGELMHDSDFHAPPEIDDNPQHEVHDMGGSFSPAMYSEFSLSSEGN